MQTALLSLDLSEVSNHFEQWRSTRTTCRARIPTHLWQEAVELCQSYPISQICQKLRLNPQALSKKRREFSSNRGFVEVLPEGDSLPFSSPKEVELLRGDGTRMAIRGYNSEELLGMVGQFLKGGRHASVQRQR